MRNIPLFTTENGVASLTLEEIPYKKYAYVRVQAASDEDAFLKECADFCMAVGAEHVYATGSGAEKFPLHNSVIRMQRSILDLPETDAVACAVHNDMLDKWRDIYNSRMADVNNAATMTVTKAKKAFGAGGCYFVYKGNCLLGIGMITNDTVNAIATVVPGAGKDVLVALCRMIGGDSVCVEVSTANDHAMKLYEKLGFREKERISDWYQII